MAGADYPRTYPEFRDWFPDEPSCVDYLADLRWPEGFICPACCAGEHWRTGKGLWMCRACGRKTSVTAGTIFHRSKYPLSTWFAAIWFVTSQKNGVSALGLQQVLGFGSYETAWTWLHKLRRSMVQPDREQLRGVVELDETFLGADPPANQAPAATRSRSWSPSSALDPTSSDESASASPASLAHCNWWTSASRPWPPDR